MTNFKTMATAALFVMAALVGQGRAEVIAENTGGKVFNNTAGYFGQSFTTRPGRP